MIDLAVDRSTGEIKVPLELVTGVEAVAQRLWIRFQTFTGEWFLDLSHGTPYSEILGQKNPDIGLISALLREVILTTPGVINILDFSADLDNASRVLAVSFTALTDEGTITATATQSSSSVMAFNLVFASLGAIV